MNIGTALILAAVVVTILALILAAAHWIGWWALIMLAPGAMFLCAVLIAFRSGA